MKKSKTGSSTIAKIGTSKRNPPQRPVMKNQKRADPTSRPTDMLMKSVGSRQRLKSMCPAPKRQAYMKQNQKKSGTVDLSLIVFESGG